MLKMLPCIVPRRAATLLGLVCLRKRARSDLLAVSRSGTKTELNSDSNDPRFVRSLVAPDTLVNTPTASANSGVVCKRQEK
jgi:hypothetical protein